MPVSVPYLMCPSCGRTKSMWFALCAACDDADELPPCVGERYRDVLDERRIESEGVNRNG